jgi:hypothetical protein
MTPLAAVIRKNGFELRVMRRAGRAGIYRQHFPGSNPDHDAYELIVPQTRNTNYKGEPVKPYEGYPAAESWGKKGWTFTTLPEAVEKLKQLAKASRRGTVSGRNRFDRQRRLRRSLLANRQKFVPVSKRVSNRVGRNRRTPMQRKLRLSSVRTGVPRLRSVTQTNALATPPQLTHQMLQRVRE